MWAILMCCMSIGVSSLAGMSGMGQAAGVGMGMGLGAGLGSGLAAGVMDRSISPLSLATDAWFIRWLTRSKYEKPAVIVARLTKMQAIMNVQLERVKRRREEMRTACLTIGKMIRQVDQGLAAQEQHFNITLSSKKADDEFAAMMAAPAA